MAAPLQHDQNLSDDIQPLLDAYPQVLARKMKDAVNYVSQLKTQGERVNLNKMMLASGINSREVATSWPNPECRRIVNEFNTDTIDTIDVLITTFAALRIPGGPSFHPGACHRGIMLETPDTLEQHFETRKVLLRGNGPFAWKVQYVPGSLDSWRDLAMAKRAVEQDQNSYPELNGFVHQQRMVLFYDVAYLMGKDESQYPRDRVHWSKLEAKEIKREGLFYFALGKFLHENRAAASKLSDRHMMSRIAKS
ncbi:hypothetical protein FVEG_09364 [Fusarium verticillioides 7600]|uniref:Uncharacterized protein n=1 Tax=Gibberella moniliformis (strain M3125 / FGSC 7600) TaxID=334819 RepID=W7MEP2_GIBM7|nr:hypothetical protein FVEG_09364 [Fusarium verticillioides 7600]EWG50028.1 hypothetical protein FVEG_09364 [Fusarium verticillioides 7600]